MLLLNVGVTSCQLWIPPVVRRMCFLSLLIAQPVMLSNICKLWSITGLPGVGVGEGARVGAGVGGVVTVAAGPLLPVAAPACPHPTIVRQASSSAQPASFVAASHALLWARRIRVYITFCPVLSQSNLKFFYA